MEEHYTSFLHTKIILPRSSFFETYPLHPGLGAKYHNLLYASSSKTMNTTWKTT